MPSTMQVPLPRGRGRPFDSQVLNVGVSKLAKELGVTPGTISQRMSKGQTAEFIRADIGRKKGLVPTSTPPRVPQATVPQARSYIPAHPLLRSGPTPGRKQQQAATPIPNGKTNGHTVAPPLIPPDEDLALLYIQAEGRSAAELRKIQAQADLQALKVEQLRGSLIPLAQVNFWFGQSIVKARDILFRIPAELRDRLSTTDDPIQCEKMLMDELVRAVAELREMPMPGAQSTGQLSSQSEQTDGDEDDET